MVLEAEELPCAGPDSTLGVSVTLHVHYLDSNGCPQRVSVAFTQRMEVVMDKMENIKRYAALLIGESGCEILSMQLEMVEDVPLAPATEEKRGEVISWPFDSYKEQIDLPL